MKTESLLKIGLALLAVMSYGVFIRETWRLEDLKFNLRTLAVLSPLLIFSSQFLLYFANHIWTFFKYN